MEILRYNELHRVFDFVLLVCQRNAEWMQCGRTNRVKEEQ